MRESVVSGEFDPLWIDQDHPQHRRRYAGAVAECDFDACRTVEAAGCNAGCGADREPYDRQCHRQAGEIVEISKSPVQARTIFDASKKLISPGLVNTHTHLAMSLLRGYAEGVDLQGFLERVWAAEGAIMDGPTAELGTKLGALEALLGGTTTTLDMYLFPEDTHRGAVATGLRHVAGPIFFDFPGLDGMEWPARIDFARSWPEILRKIGGAKVPVYLMPHATYTCSPEHLTEIAELAEEIDAPS